MLQIDYKYQVISLPESNFNLSGRLKPLQNQLKLFIILNPSHERSEVEVLK
ncbi:MAG: hypothetical protein IKI22_05765 [Neisseriaceae bacterium]|nr:hypothetical protein [Neisseriaceae bacterium]